MEIERKELWWYVNEKGSLRPKPRNYKEEKKACHYLKCN
jgi:hypothetical protein